MGVFKIFSNIELTSMVFLIWLVNFSFFTACSFLKAGFSDPFSAGSIKASISRFISAGSEYY